MDAHINLNARLVKATQAQLAAFSENTFYGRGVFTTIAINGGQAFQWQAHWARLVEHAARIHVVTDEWTEDGTREQLETLLDANKVERGRARVMLLARSTPRTVPGLWRTASGEDERHTDLLIATAARRSNASENPLTTTETQGLALTVSPYRLNTLSPLAGLKTTNYLDHLLAWEEARARDFDEAVMLNERGEVTSATLANLFWTRDGTLYTPTLACAAMAGTTRLCVMRLAAALSIPVVEGTFELAHLTEADEIFLTSTGRGIALITTFDFRRYTVAAGSIIVSLREALRQEMLQN